MEPGIERGGRTIVGFAPSYVASGDYVTSDDTELIVQAQTGNAFAFEQLVHRYDRHVLSIAASYTRNIEDARDVYQEVFIRVFRSLKTFRFESKFSTWLHRIATNVCLTHQTQSRRRQHESLDESWNEEGARPQTVPAALVDHGSPDRHTIDSEISEHLQKALELLSPQQKLVFTLRHYEGYKLKEIASMMNCAEGTVKKYLFTATERMRGQLKDLIG